MYENSSDYTLENTTPVTIEGFAGYNHVINHLLIGGEVVLTGANYQEVGFPGYHFSGVADARARVGYESSGWLAYLFGGVSAGIFDYSGDSSTLGGTNFGVGVSALVTDNLFIGAEFTQRNLMGEVNFGKGKNINLDSTTRTVSVRAGMQF